MKTAMQQLRKSIKSGMGGLNMPVTPDFIFARIIEIIDGIYIPIEKEQLISFHTETIRVGLQECEINFTEDDLKESNECAERVYNNKFKNNKL